MDLHLVVLAQGMYQVAEMVELMAVIHMTGMHTITIIRVVVEVLHILQKIATEAYYQITLLTKMKS